jgi:hypothetical protein
VPGWVTASHATSPVIARELTEVRDSAQEAE